MFNALRQMFTPVEGPDWIFSGSGDDVICLHDPAGRFLKVSESSGQVLGYQADALQAKTFADLVVPEDRGNLMSLVMRACLSQQPGRLECRLMTAEDRVIWAEIGVSVDGQGRVRSVIRDVSHRRSQDRKLSAAKMRAEEEVVHRTNHLADLSHEVRTPLSAMIGFADMMRCETFGPLGHEKYAEYAELIHKSGQHLLELVSDLLDFSKIEAGKYELQCEQADVMSIVRDCAEISRLAAENAGLELFFEESDTLHATVDSRVVRQILLNLLSNAVKFTKEGQISVQVREDKNHIWIAVQDTGIGMTAEELERVGERYEQAHQSGVRGVRGTGLGLALCKALAQLHGGELRLASQKHMGTTAVLELPRKQKNHPEADRIDFASSKPIAERVIDQLSDQLTNNMQLQRQVS